MRVPEEGLRFAHMLVHELKLKGQLKCLSCGSELPDKMSYYPHLSGDYWCYVECPSCGYQNALWKLKRKAELSR